jgi:putative GTP pyrophosphokinase
MRHDYHEVKSDYTSIYPTLEKIAAKLEEQLTEILIATPNIDRVICRVKGIESFMAKTNKQEKDGGLKYAVPMREIQDMVGARVVVYYKTDVQSVRDIISEYYPTVEKVHIVPDDATKFGYEGFHMVCFIPNSIFSSRENPLVSNFFELQIKTLYQHAWSQSNHGLGYKPGTELSSDNQRMLAFVAAQSWGADKALAELVMGQG